MVKTCCVYMFGCVSCSAGKEKALSFHRLPTDWCWYILQGLPSSTRRMWRRPWKTEQKKRKDKDEKKNSHDEPNENLSGEKWRSDEKKLKTWLARMQNSHGKVKKMLECVERLRRWTPKQCFTHAFRPFSHGQSRLHLGILPRKDVDSLPLPCSVVPVRRQGQDLDRHASLFFQVVDRQDGADDCAVSDTGPVETAADHQRSGNWSRSGLEKSAAIRPFATKKSRLASEKNPFSGQFGDWKLPFTGQVVDQTFFKADNADADRTRSRKVRGSLCRSKPESWPFGPHRSCLPVNPPRGLGAFPIPEPLLSRPSELNGAEEISYAFWLPVCAAHQPSTWVFFSSGLSRESAPVHRKRLAFAASVRSKKKKKKKTLKKVRRRSERRRQQQRGGKFQRASVMLYTYMRITCRYGSDKPIKQ